MSSKSVFSSENLYFMIYYESYPYVLELLVLHMNGIILLMEMTLHLAFLVGVRGVMVIRDHLEVDGLGLGINFTQIIFEGSRSLLESIDLGGSILIF